ncbi:MAG: ABC transporter permease [Candidatus Thorarchaeota archaeon]|jgi:ABC-2 type transport system permease protein
MKSKKKSPNESKKTVWLLKKEVKSVLRSRWLLLGFMISPLFAWLFQGFFLNFLFATAIEPEQVYITNEDGLSGNSTWGDHLYNNLMAQFEYEKGIADEQKWLNYQNFTTVTSSEGMALWDNRTAPVWILIPANFTEVFESFNITTLTIYVNSGSFRASAAFERTKGFAQLLMRTTDLWVQQISPPAAEASYGHQLAIFLVMITSVMAPSPYISKSFAGERENNTLEALLVVPMSRLRILGAKLVAGLLLTMIYSVFTVVGILTYNALVLVRGSGSLGSQIGFYSVAPSTIPLIFFCQFLILLCAIGIGVVISTMAKDQATSESINNLVLLVPTMVIGILGFAGSISQVSGLFGLFVWLIPFSHAIMFLNGVLSPAPDVFLLSINVIYMLAFTIVFLIIGAKAFEREAIIA